MPIMEPYRIKVVEPIPLLTRADRERPRPSCRGAYPDRFRLVRIMCDDYDLTWSEEVR